MALTVLLIISHNVDLSSLSFADFFSWRIPDFKTIKFLMI